MPAPATMTTTIEFPPTPEGVAAAREELDELDTLFGDDERAAATSDPKPLAPTSPSDEAPRAVYRSATDGSRTREMLKALPGDVAEALTLAEIGELLTPNDDGSPLNAAQARAVHRNEKKIEYTLKKRGVIREDREVVKQDWSEAEGVGRYYVSAADREVIQSL